MSVSPTLLAAAPFEHLSEGLTPDQAAAVTHGRGPQVIFAGPGAGKTRTLTDRVRYLLATGRAIPREIVLVTFTNNAARECSERLERMLGRAAIAGMAICTFHALCLRLLRAHAQLVGRTANFTIYDERALRGVLEEILKDQTRTGVLDALDGSAPCPIEEITEEISLAKSRLWTPQFYAQHSRHNEARLVAAVWAELDQELERSNAVSLDDLLCLAVGVLGDNPSLQAHYRARWRWLLVDEVQDTCYAQMGLLRLLAQPEGNLSICGDADQALYGFRGAEPGNLLSFRALFPSRRTVTLAVNFRSREEIVRHAEAVISHNQRREQIDFTAARGRGGQVTVKDFDNEHAEGGWIAKEIARQLRTGVKAEQILVLARSAFAYSPVRKALESAGIAHHVLGSLGLFERGEVKTALAYLQLIANPLDVIALRRAIQHPRREVGEKSCHAIVEHAHSQQIDLLEACVRQEQIPGLRKRARENLERFAKQMLAIRDTNQHGAPVNQTVNRVLGLRGGLERYYRWVREHPQKPQAREQADASLVLLAGMRQAAARYQQQDGTHANLHGFLERAVGLHCDGPAIVNEGVGFSTIHGAKGMQAPVVFLCGCEEDITPSRHAIAARRVSAIEDERCAFYVGMTRAEDLLVISWAGVRKGRATRGRSRFIEEAGL